MVGTSLRSAEMLAPVSATTRRAVLNNRVKSSETTVT